MYGGAIINRKKEKPAVTRHSMDMKDSGKTLATINQNQWVNLPNFDRTALANEPDADGLQNAHFT